MPTTRRESSADSAARFLTLRGNQAPAQGGRVAPAGDDPAARLVRWMAAVDQVARAAPPDRVLVDFAKPTLRLIREVLRDAIQANFDFGDRGALLLIAEEMVAAALGEPPCDDPPLTDREVR